jgi:hypothetical protein
MTLLETTEFPEKAARFMDSGPVDRTVDVQLYRTVDVQRVAELS